MDEESYLKWVAFRMELADSYLWNRELARRAWNENLVEIWAEYLCRYKARWRTMKWLLEGK